MSLSKVLVFLCLLGTVAAVSAANSDKAVKKSRAAVSLQQVKPVIKGNSIYYGQRVVMVNQDGSIVCRQPDGDVFSQTHYWVETKNRKYFDSFSPQRKKNNRFIMEPVKFADNTFTQKGKYSWKGVTGEFIQTVKLLPDGRLEIANQLSLPVELRARVVEDGFFFNFPGADTYGKELTLIGPKKDSKRIITVQKKDNCHIDGSWSVVPTQIVFGKGTCKQVIFTTNSSTRGWNIRNYGRRTAFRAMATPRKNPNRYSSIIVDVTAIPSWKNNK